MSIVKIDLAGQIHENIKNNPIFPKNLTYTKNRENILIFSFFDI